MPLLPLCTNQPPLFVSVLQSSRLKLDPYLKASALCCYQQDEVNSGDNF